MAKLKKYKIKLPDMLAWAAVVLGLAAIFMTFAPGAVCSIGSERRSFTCFQLMLGYTETSGVDLGFTTISGAVVLFKFSIGNFLTYIFILIGILSAIFVKKCKYALLVTVATFAAAAVLFFFTPDMCVTDESLFFPLKDRLSIGGGAIAGGVILSAATLLSAVSFYLKK